MGNNVRRRHHRGHDKGANDEVSSSFLELLDVQNPELDQHDQRHRHLESQTESQEHGHHEGQIGFDIRCRRDALGRKVGDEVEDLSEDKEIAEGHAEQEQQRARHDQRQAEPPLMGVQTRGDESPGLEKDVRQCYHEGDHRRHLQRNHERRHDADRHHLGAFRQSLGQRCGKEIVDRAGSRIEGQSAHHHGNGDQAAQQAIAQLDEMRDEGFFLVVFGHAGVLSAESRGRTSAAGGCSTEA